MKNLIREINKFAEERDWGQFHTPKNLIMALSVEVAEIMEHFQWLTQEESGMLTETKQTAIEDEIGDTFIYLLRLCEVLDVDLLKVTRNKLEKNRRKYPVDKARGNAKKYTEI